RDDEIRLRVPRERSSASKRLMDRSLLDTDIYSEILRGKSPQLLAVAQAYREEHGIYHLSASSVYEMVKGFQQAGRIDRIDKLLLLLNAEDVIDFDRELAVFAGRIHGELIRSGRDIGRIDPMIAATAIRHGLTLVTGNTTHFQRIIDLGFPLQLANWRL
ncbi:MAG TPA: PIN domain-containing protein, partial [Lacipirellulaceae bacterium]|nr:PIN domain-containing protein [Lacipirellulaceae bacterium]